MRASASDGVLIMMNKNDDSGVMNRICKAAWDENKLSPPWPVVNQKLDPSIDPKVYPEYAGHFDYGDAIQVITVENGHLFAQLTDQEKIELLPSGRDTFFFKDIEAGIIFERDSLGTVVDLLHIQDGKIFKAPKLPAK